MRRIRNDLIGPPKRADLFLSLDSLTRAAIARLPDRPSDAPLPAATAGQGCRDNRHWIRRRVPSARYLRVRAETTAVLFVWQFVQKSSPLPY